MIIDSLVDELDQMGPAWLWFAVGMRNGDVHHVCSLAKAFIEEHGSDLPMRLVVTSGERVAQLHRQVFASVHVRPAFQPDEADWREFFLRRQLPFFGPNVPLVLHPDLSPRTSSLHAFVAHNRIVWGQIYKSALSLPPDAEPAPLPASSAAAAEAAALLAENGMPPGRSMILFPYAQSFPVSAAKHFEALAEAARSKGWTVFTSVAEGEAAITGTQPVFIPFELLIDVAEQAGWVVAVRSGICDITATSNCRKTFIFSHGAGILVWGVDALELARDARQFAFSFSLNSPVEFCERVFKEENEVPNQRVPALSELALRSGRTAANVRDFSDEVRGGRGGPSPRRVFGRRQGSEALINLPRRDHPRLGDAAREAVGRLIERRGKADIFYSCRDRFGAFDYLEEVDRVSLEAGRYAAADKWHTIIATEGEGLKPGLPQWLEQKVLSRTPFELGHFQHLGRALPTAAHYSYLEGEKPIDLSGLQLLNGWYDLEPWGVWSKGDVSVLKISTIEPPASAVALVVDCKLIVTQVDGVLSLRVRVNGEELLAREVREAENATLKIVIPPYLLINSTAYVEFHHPGARSPHRLGHSGDLRRMALGLVGAVLQHHQA